MALTDGLVGEWLYSGNANDSAGSNNGSVNGASLTSDDSSRSNEAYNFDGINDYISMTSAIDGSVGSMEFIYKPNWTANTSSNTYYIFDTDNGSGRYLLYYDGSLQRYRLYINGTLVFTLSGLTHTSGDYVHVIITWTTSPDDYACYKDGSKISSTYNNSTDGTPSTIYIGSRYNQIDYFDGDIASVRLWNRKLTTTEITSLYNSGNYLYQALSNYEGINFQINIGDVWKDVDALKINIGDAWKSVEGAQINIGDTWKTIF